MNKEERFILVETFKDDSIKTIIGSFNEICNEIEYQNKKADSDACEIGIFSQKDLVNIELAFDHAKIINDCLNAVSSKF